MGVGLESRAPLSKVLGAAPLDRVRFDVALRGLFEGYDLGGLGRVRKLCGVAGVDRVDPADRIQSAARARGQPARVLA